MNVHELKRLDNLARGRATGENKGWNMRYRAALRYYGLVIDANPGDGVLVIPAPECIVNDMNPWLSNSFVRSIPPVKLEDGATYRTRTDKIVGPMERNPHDGLFGAANSRWLWRADGLRERTDRLEGITDDYDLLHEVVVFDLPADREVEHRGDKFHYLLEAVDQLGGRHDPDNSVVWFTEKGFENFAVKTKLLVYDDTPINPPAAKIEFHKVPEVKAELELFCAKLRDTLANSFGLSFDVLSANYGRAAKSASIAMDEHKIRAKFIERLRTGNYDINKMDDEMMNIAQVQLKLKPWTVAIAKANRFKLPSGPGVSRKGWPQIDSVWEHPGGRFYVVKQHSRITTFNDEYNKVFCVADDMVSPPIELPLNLWHQMKFHSHSVGKDATARKDDAIPSRVFYTDGHFRRVSASGKSTYPMSAEFRRTWIGRQSAFPKSMEGATEDRRQLHFLHNLFFGGNYKAPKSIEMKPLITPKVRITFTSLFEPSPRDSTPMKFKAALRFPKGGLVGDPSKGTSALSDAIDEIIRTDVKMQAASLGEQVIYDMLTRGKPASDLLPVMDGVDEGWPIVGTLWRHKNNNRYRVTGRNNIEGTKPDYPRMVEYKNEDTGAPYSRKLSEWLRSMTYVNELDLNAARVFHQGDHYVLAEAFGNLKPGTLLVWDRGTGKLRPAKAGDMRHG